MITILKNESARPKEIISALKTIPDLKTAYETKVRHYTLEAHTLLVMEQFDKYFSTLDIIMPRNLFRLLLALHDIGKPRAFLEGNINNQYQYTIQMINQIRNQLPFRSKSVDFCVTLINGDPVGLYLQGKIDLATATTVVHNMAAGLPLSTPDFFRILTMYYQCDAAAYTVDAGGLRFLEHLFLYKDNLKQMNIEKGVLHFSPTFDIKYLQLEKSVK
jgi:hypothetical protein